ncbi:PAS domain-containing protein [Fulvimarina sp. MAC8]|uniref:PAS domain-containing protein n=1 Tax=Fulvimarina sp. MAC8 TaxID=3162874 RepID=UPI0032ED6C8F
MTISSNSSAEIEIGTLADETLVQLFERARSAIVLTDPSLDDNPIVACNDAFLELTGYPKEEVLGRNCRFLQGVGTEPMTVRELSRCVASERSGQFEILNFRKNGSPFWNALHIGPIFGADGRVQYFFGSQYDISETVEFRLSQMREHERLSYALQAASAIGTFDWNVKNDVLAVNEGFAIAFGLDPSAAAEGLPVDAFFEHVDEADREELKQATAKAVQTGEPFEHEYGVKGSDRHRWLLGRGRCFYDEHGKPTRFSGVVVDITRRKTAEDDLKAALEKSELLRNEIDHRIKNLFAVVPAIVNLSSRLADNTEDLAASIQQRIAALARAHSLTIGLASSKHGVLFDALCKAVLDPYTDDHEPFVLTGQKLRMGQTEASATALMLHELATNAAKYGALTTVQGSVSISWTVTEHDNPEGSLKKSAEASIVWKETGGPVVAGHPERHGSGSQLIDKLVRSLGGVFKREWEQDGLRASLRLPVRVFDMTDEYEEIDG